MKEIIIGSLLALVVASAPAYSADDDAQGKFPLPAGLSKDTQFIIYYMDKRFEALQREMDRRFEQVDRRFEQVDKRFEQVDKRFQDVNKRFDQMMTFLWMLTGIFTSITLTTIAFALWDRRSMMKQAKDEAIKQIEKEGRLQDFIRALRAYARKNAEFADILRSFNLL